MVAPTVSSAFIILIQRRIAYSNRLQEQDAMQRQQGSYDDVRFPMYQPRNAVLLRNMRRGVQPNSKFNEKWEPGYIISRVGPTEEETDEEKLLGAARPPAQPENASPADGRFWTARGYVNLMMPFRTYGIDGVVITTARVTYWMNYFEKVYII